MYKKLILILTLSSIGLCMPVDAADNSTKLKGLLKQITKIKVDIKQKEKQQISVEQQLKNLKIKIKTLGANYLATVKNLKQQKKVLVKLNNNQTKQQMKLQETRKKFSAQMISAYKTEQANYTRTIFSKDNKPNPEQILAYHRYIFIARLNQMHSIRKTLKNIEINKQQIKKQTKILENLENKQQQQKQELIQVQQERNKILGSLKNKIAAQNQKLKKLISAKENLEKLITQLSPRQTVAISSKLMTQLCKNFVWPTQGVITTRFGSPIEQSTWRWSGIIIVAPENQGIHAISSGKVVYADWFTGYGLLLIIDHGNGYMSLYGHNTGFRKKLNDEVLAGEIVATVGKSGCEEPRLYFAIRYNGKPVDPERWCK